MTFSSMLLLLLLAWHFSIQAAVHDATLLKVRGWLQSLEATSGEIDYRMLRGALTIHNLKVSVYGSPLTMKRLFIKGNPASIMSEKPLLHQVEIHEASFDAQALLQAKDSLNMTLPTSLLHIFQHAKSITVTNSSVSHLAGLPHIHIRKLNVFGAAQARQVTGQGYFDAPQDAWLLQSDLTNDGALQHGHITFNQQTILGQMDWSGAVDTNHMQFTLQQSDAQQPNAFLKAQLFQDGEAWQANIEAQSWVVNNDDFSAVLSGKATAKGTYQDWHISSPSLQAEDFTMTQPSVVVKQLHMKGVKIHSKMKAIDIEYMLVKQADVSIDPYPLSQLDWLWDMRVKHIEVIDLKPSIMVNQQSLQIPALYGSAHVAQQQLYVNMATQGDEQQWVLKTNRRGVLKLSASKVRFSQLRQWLPSPLRQQATALQGYAKLQLDIQPFQHWKTSGNVELEQVGLTLGSQKFYAKRLEAYIKAADKHGVKEASIDAEDWHLALPLTPLQSWSNASHFDAWAKMDWAVQSINLRRGKVFLGQDKQAWLSDAKLTVKDWQSDQLSTLALQGRFGMADLKLHMKLGATADQVMRWQKLTLKVQYANIFALNPWLKLSGLPEAEQGHISIALTAQRQNQAIQGEVSAVLKNCTWSEQALDEDFLQYKVGESAQQFLYKLDCGAAAKLSSSFQGEADWSMLIGQVLLEKAMAKVSAFEVHKSTTRSRTLLGSLRERQGRALSHNERTRLRKMIKVFKKNQGELIELEPDLGTIELDPSLQDNIQRRQQVISKFLRQQGIPRQHIYAIVALSKHRSMGGAGGIHVYMVK